MFTVIIAEKETIKLFEETKMFFGPLLSEDKVAFCEWYKDADSFDLMVPDLYELIEYQNEWRALVLHNDDIDRHNPFDYTEYREPFGYNEKRGWEYFANRRKNRFMSFEKAISNPLLKLTAGLCETPNFKSAFSDSELFDLLASGEMPMYEYMLKSQLEALNCSEVAARIEKYQRRDLNRFVAEEEIDSLITCIRTSDAIEILKLISESDIVDFIRYIGNDPIYYDPEYTECLIENTQKASLLNSFAAHFSLKDKLPDEIICFSPRTFDFENAEQDIKWQDNDERAYSRFAEFNLYNEKLKFLLFDMLPKDNKQYKFDQIKFMCLLLIIANNDLPQGLVTSSRVYRADIDFDSGIVSKICENYISKLKATELLLKDIEMQLDCDHEVAIDDTMARRLFESDINIPVKIVSEYTAADLYSEYKQLGLSTDCPADELDFWSRQFRNIKKSFVKYLREPRRAVKTAVIDGFRKNNFVDDERSLLLSEDQIEDINFHLLEEEQKMISTSTTHLFDTNKYNEQIEEADQEIRRGIAQRMTKKKTLFIGLFAALTYLAGFLPMIFSNFNTKKTLLISMGVALGAVAVFLLIGFVYLFSLKKKLVNRFKHFNYVMSGICNSITDALGQFSTYISCACNVMRDFSALKKRDSAVTRIKRVLVFHNLRINEQVERVHDIFSKYVDFSKVTVKDCKPYDYDFTLMCDYDYEMPSIKSKKRIEFLQQGHEIVIPIDYVDSITLTREELYD